MMPKRKISLLSIVCYSSVILLFILTVIFLPKLIRINSVSCQSQFGPCSTQVGEELKKAQGFNLYSSKKMLQRILSKDALVKDYFIQFKLPDRFEVNIIEKKPKYALTSEDKSLFVLIDKEGEVLSQADITNLPYLVTGNLIPKTGEKVESGTLFGLEIVFGMFSHYQINSAVLEDESLTIEINSGLKLIFPLDGDREILLGSANLVLAQLKNESENSKIENVPDVKIVDLRFKNPVLK